MTQIAEESLKLHYEKRGKIEVVSTVPVKTREDLSLAYTPGVAEPCKVLPYLSKDAPHESLPSIRPQYQSSNTPHHNRPLNLFEYAPLNFLLTPSYQWHPKLKSL